MRTTAPAATRLAVDALRIAGIPRQSAELQADLLVEADTRGVHSHGLLRLPRIVERIRNGVTDPSTSGKARWVGQALLDVDGEQGLGPAVAVPALAQISDRAATTGIACAAIRSSNHLGMLGWYVRRIAQEGLVAVALTTSEAIMHPWGGRAAMVGSNPIAIGVPADPEPLVVDMATTRVAMGKIHDYAHRGRALEPGWALDEEGTPTTDASAARRGSIAPFGGAKGYGLGLAFEVLVGALTGAALGTEVTGTLDSVHPATKGDLFIVARLASAAPILQLSRYLQEVRRSPRQVPDVPVTVPGDGSGARRRDALREGFELPDELWEQLTALADAAPVGATARSALGDPASTTTKGEDPR
jgi:L-2-hydroxycarboxylate dehydrogenase (NAD+)